MAQIAELNISIFCLAQTTDLIISIFGKTTVSDRHQIRVMWLRLVVVLRWRSDSVVFPNFQHSLGQMTDPTVSPSISHRFTAFLLQG